MNSTMILVSGATGLVGSHVIERAKTDGLNVRALVRPDSDLELLKKWDVETVVGELDDRISLQAALDGITHVVHCAAKVGDWGPVSAYRKTNVDGLRNFLDAAIDLKTIQQFVHISSLGVYEARNHYGTDETEPMHQSGIDGYTLTKVEAEELLQTYVAEKGFPAIVLRPGFIYGPRDRTVMPRLVERLRSGSFAYLGSGEQLLNNIYVGNLVDAIFLALDHNEFNGQVFNLTDDRLVTRIEFIEAICDQTGLSKPTKHVPLPVARVLAFAMESTYRILRKQQAPLLSQARLKFLGLNLDFNSDKAKHILGYQPKVDFREGIQETLK